MVLEAWEQFCQLLQPATIRRNEAEHRLHLITGGVISCWSLDAPDTIRGSAYARVIIDEAAMVPHLDRVWQQILRPTLTDCRGDAWFLSTPRGLGFFHTLFQAGLAPQDEVGGEQGDSRAWASFCFPSCANPHLPADEIEAARPQLSERDYAQEYLGQFLETDGSVFTNVLGCVVDALPQTWQAGHEFLMGVDWGRLRDATACVVIDVTVQPKAVVATDRFTKLDYHRQLARIKALGTRFGVMAVIAERNALGDPLTEQLRRDLPVPVHPFTTTAVSKRQGLDRLILAFERQDITLLRDDALIHELLAYSARTLPLMLAWEGSRFVLTREQWRMLQRAYAW